MSLLALRPVRRGLFHNHDRSLNFHRLFNNRILNRSLSTTDRAIRRTQRIRSVRNCFLQPNSTGLPIICRISQIHSNNDFDAHQIATVRGNRPVFAYDTSFRCSRRNFRRRARVPRIINPRDLPSRLRLFRRHTRLVPRRVHRGLLYPGPVRIHPIARGSPCGPRPTSPVGCI